MEELLRVCNENKIKCEVGLCEDCNFANIEYPFCTKALLADGIKKAGFYKIPCKIGDQAFAIRNYRGKKKPMRGFVNNIYFSQDMELIVEVKHIGKGKWNKKVFATREEAEKEIEKQEGKANII